LGVFYGFIIAILLYSLFIFVSLREKSYLFYTLYLSSFLIYQLNSDGFGYLYLWPESKWMIQYSAIIGWNMTLFLYLLFSLSFLNTKIIIPKINRLFQIYAGLFIVNILLLPVIGVLQVCKITAPLQLALFFLLILMSVYLMIKRIRLAYYYFIAVCFLMGGSLITNLLVLKGGHISYFAKYSIHYGILLEILILAFGLSDRLTTMRKDKERAAIMAIKTEQKLLKTKAENLNTLILKKEAEQANRFKSEFLANVSHELRTPMQSILGWSKLAIERMDVLRKDKLKEYFSDISASGDRLLSQINELLDTAKLEKGQVDYTFKHGLLSDSIKLVIQELVVLARDKQITVDFSPPTNELLVEIDYSRISQVLTNLLANAIKFSEKNTDIQIEIKCEKKYIECSLQDNGPGIAANEKEIIFEQFVQSSSTSSINGGTGLGLAICKEIIEAHNGKIWAENNPEGGSTFNFMLPYEAEVK